MQLRWMIAACLVVMPASARAQAGIDAELFHPSLDTFGILGTERTETAPPWDFGFKLFTNYADSPLRLAISNGMPSSSPPALTPVMSRQIGIDFDVHLGLTRWLELAIALPMSAQDYTDAYGQPGNGAMVPTGFSVADPSSRALPPKVSPLDPRLAFKARLLANHGFGLGLVALLTAPFGGGRGFVGESSFTFHPQVIADYTYGPFTLAVNVGAIVRQTSSVYDPYDQAAQVASPRLLLQVGHELTWSAAVAYRFVKWVGFAAQVAGLKPLVGANPDDTADVLGAVQIYPGGGIALVAGGGANVFTNARRHDGFRVFLGIQWARSAVRSNSAVDSDHDGVPDDIDLCPHEPEDHDGFQDSDGCPDLDNDADGIPDVHDRCPNDPEDRDSFQDADGCPDIDNDNDGIPDVHDRCPNEAEDRDGFQDEDGCPDPDNDEDGIPDAHDQCPNEPETYNGVDDKDGCPDPGMTPHVVEIPEVLEFEPGKVQPAHAEAVLQRIADRLNANSHVRRVRIEGHADGIERKDKAALQLSQERAEAVRQALIRRGVDESRLQAVGYGNARLLATGHGTTAAAKNRRVEFVVVDQ